MSPSEAAILDLTVVLALWAAIILSAKRNWWPLSQSAFPLWASLCPLPKAYLAARLMSDSLRPTAAAWLWTAGLLLSLVVPLILLPQRASRWSCWSFVALLSLLLWADVVYYRAFDDFLSVSLWSGIHQTHAVTDSLQHLLSSADLVLLVNLLLVLPAVWVTGAEPERRPDRRWALLALLPALLFLAFNLVTRPLSSQFLQHRFSNRAQVGRNGLLAYHLYDIYHSAKPLFLKPEPIPDELVWQRLSLTRNSIGSGAPYFGAARGSNILMMQLESFQSFVIGMRVEGQEVTPFLNRLRRQSLYGEALDQTSHGASSDAEYVMLNGLLPPTHGPLCFLYVQNDFRALPFLLSERGWSTFKAMPYDGAFWNARRIGERYGYQQQQFVEAFPPARPQEVIGWGLSDSATFEQLVPKLQALPKPFFCYLTTVMMHHPFDELRPEQELLKLPLELKTSMAGDYLQLARLRDQAIEELVAKMRQSGLWEDTVLVLCGDHRSRLDDGEVERLGVLREKPLLDRVPLFIHLPGDKAVGELPGSLGQIDVSPTLLHLLGIADANPVMVGRNALAGAKASVSPGGFLTNGAGLTVWQGKLDRSNPQAAALHKQMEEELQLSDNLVVTNRISHFAREGPSTRTANWTR